MIVSFTQTYGDNRKELYDIHHRDNHLLAFKDLFDLNIYSFHNCSKETINYFKSIHHEQNAVYFEFNNISYGETIEYLLSYLKEINCTHLFFSQDDTFSVDTTVDYNELFEYIKSNKENFMLSLFYSNGHLDIIPTPDEYFNTFNIFHTTSQSFTLGVWGSMDDTPFICSTDLLYKIYNKQYTLRKDIWEMELYLMRIYKKININRYVADKSMFKNYNIIGKTTGQSNMFRKELKLKGLIP